MKNEGVVRAIDPLGRVVIPKEMRKRCRIEVGDPVEFRTEGGQIIITRAAQGCVFCGSEVSVDHLLGQPICLSCREKVKKEA
ncbi:MAG: AbrB/MazE/SpoVT family DNA-binding domain-containing protein [Clostridia bacterium]|nr:AbrB/MazE/SpoVT family DNA-binding domain-containing protein [Clostridia bacterium]